MRNPIPKRVVWLLDISHQTFLATDWLVGQIVATCYGTHLMFWLLVAALTWTVSLWLIWRLVKAGADEDQAREQLRRHLNEVA